MPTKRTAVFLVLVHTLIYPDVLSVICGFSVLAPSLIGHMTYLPHATNNYVRIHNVTAKPPHEYHFLISKRSGVLVGFNPMHMLMTFILGKSLCNYNGTPHNYISEVQYKHYAIWLSAKLIFIGVISCNLPFSSAIMIMPRIIELPAGYCPSTEELLESLKSNTSDILSRLMIVPQCGDGLWYRVAYINTSDSTQECPPNWTEISTPVRTCGRPTSTGPSCPGVYLSTRSLRYNKVCGRAIGYQDGSTDGFRLFGQPPPINSCYYDKLIFTVS